MFLDRFDLFFRKSIYLLFKLKNFFGKLPYVLLVLIYLLYLYDKVLEGYIIGIGVFPGAFFDGEICVQFLFHLLPSVKKVVISDQEGLVFEDVYLHNVLLFQYWAMVTTIGGTRRSFLTFFCKEKIIIFSETTKNLKIEKKISSAK